MGSNESTPQSRNKAVEEARLRALAEKVRKDNEKLEVEKNQLYEQYWRNYNLREEEKRKETEQERRRQADLEQLRLQQEKAEKALVEQKKLQKLFQKQLQRERKEKQELKAKIEEERRQHAEIKEQQLLLQKVHIHQQHSRSVPITPLLTASPPMPSTLRQTVALQQRTSTVVESNQQQPKEPPESYLKRMSDSKVKYVEWSIISYIQDENSISATVTENIMKLLDDKNTIPFIARYRRHLTQGMDPERLRKVRNSYEQAKLIKQRAVSIIKDIQDKGLWTPEVHALVHETRSLVDLDQIHLTLKIAKSKVAKMAAKAGLEIVAEACILHKTPPIPQLVQSSVEVLKTEEQVRDAIVALMADIIIKDRRTFNVVKKLRSKHQMELQSRKCEGADKLNKNASEYESYYKFTSLESKLGPDQVFAINRGEALKVLSIKIKIPDEFGREFEEQCLQQFRFTDSVDSLKKTLMKSAIDFAYNKSIKGYIARRTRQDINERARITAIRNLEENVKQALLAPPVRGKVVIGIKPGFETGCQLAVVSERGHLLETRTIYPHTENNPRSKKDAERILVQLICKRKCTVLALGTGLAAKETEIFLVHVIKNNKKIPSNVFYVFVDSSAASIYSCSREAALEFPQIDADFISAVSIARRLQDPMSELVKIEPEVLTAEIYQQELPENKKATNINDVIVDAVSYVGVDVNTAHVALLKRVAGLDEAKANSIVEWRRSQGPIVKRNDLLKISGINKRVFKQCAGFVRIVPETVVAISGKFRRREVPQDLFDRFDQTWIHPESYNVAKSLVEAAQSSELQLGTSNFIFTLNLYARTGYTELAKRFDSTAETIEMIVQGLRIEKGQDIRGMADSSVFRRSLVRYDDLIKGQVLTGVVTHLAAFGAFVDVGAEIDGLIHNNFMNGLTVAVHQKVEVRINNIEKERGRLGLTLIRCI